MINDRLKSFSSEIMPNFFKNQLNLSSKFLKYLIYRQVLPKKKTLGLRPSWRLPWYHIRSMRIWLVYEYIFSVPVRIYTCLQARRRCMNPVRGVTFAGPAWSCPAICVQFWLHIYARERHWPRICCLAVRTFRSRPCLVLWVKKFLNIIALSFVFYNYCLIID